MKIQELSKALDEIRREGLYRSVSDLAMKTASCGVDRNGKEYIVFSSNDYLGMTHEAPVIEAARKALSRGTGSGGARLTSGATFQAGDLEKALARFKGKEAALVFNTGYMANVGILYGLAGKDDVIFSDALNHASIIDGCRISPAKTVVYRHSDMDDLARLLEDTPCGGQRFIVTDGVFSMDGDICPLPALYELKKKYDACLIVDDAHATGVIGETGRGTAEYFHLPRAVDIQAGTLSKALGAEGGFAAASEDIVNWLRNRSRPFIFSTALPASVMAAAGAALRLLEEEGKTYLGRLRQNTDTMRRLLREGGIPVIAGDTPVIPIIMNDPEGTVTFAGALREEGILVSAIRPPTVPEGTSRLRLTVTAAHKEEEIHRAAAAIIRLWQRGQYHG